MAYQFRDLNVATRVKEAIKAKLRGDTLTVTFYMLFAVLIMLDKILTELIRRD